MKRFSLIFIISFTFILGCTSKKDNNPLVSKNVAPSLAITGFAQDTLVFVADKEYPFVFSAGDERIDPDISLRVIGGTGRVTFLDTSTTGVFNATYEPFARGDHKIEITISDGLERTAQILDVFFAANQPPVAAITVTEVSRDLENLLFTYEFSPSASNDHDSEITTAIWNLDGTTFTKPFSEDFQHTFNYYKSYRIELTVIDEYDSTNMTVTTINNSRPIASFTISPAAEGQNSDNITLNAGNSQSPNGDITDYEWLSKSPSGLISILDETTSSRFVYPLDLPVGESALGLIVIDEIGNLSDTTWIDFEVINTPPDADFDYNTNLELITITSNESDDIDPDDELTFEWYVNDILLTDYTNQTTPNINIRGDNYTLRLDVTDSQGATTSAIENVSVPGVPESHFEITNVNLNNETRNLQTVVLDASESIAGNESSGIERYTWYMRIKNGAPTILADTAAAFKELNIAHPVGVYEIGLVITNEENRQSERIWQELVILNSNPTVAFNVSSGSNRSAIVTSNNSADIDPDQTINYLWFIDGVEDESKRSIALPTWTGLQLGNRSIMLRVEDTAGGYAELTRTVFIQ